MHDGQPATAPGATGTPFPSQARVVVIGGGIVGASVAFHLTERGWKDVVLLERKKLTSGTTWHAAGLVGQLRATYNMTVLASYAKDLFREVERRTGDSTGFVQHGSILVAHTEGRWDEIRRNASMARLRGVDIEFITPERVGELWPLVNTDGMVGAAFIPGDGMANPVDTTLAIAKAARIGGAQVFENTKVTRVLRSEGRVSGVETERGTIACEYVVNCTGMWARELGLQDDVVIPLHAAEHFYLVTEEVAGLAPDLPVLRMPDEQAYVRNEAGKLMVGFFEPGAKPWATHGIPEDAGVRHPAGGLGPPRALHPQGAPTASRSSARWASSCSSTARRASPRTTATSWARRPSCPATSWPPASTPWASRPAAGPGKAVADWVVDGHPPMDLWEVDIRRFMPFQRNRRYLHDRTTETLGLLYEMHWPFRQVETARGIRRSPLHDRLAAKGACFGEVYGWERANWYAPAGVEPVLRVLVRPPELVPVLGR